MTIDSMEYATLIEPPFYGTGPLITWEPGTLLAAVDRDHFFQLLRGGEALDVSASVATEKKEFDSAFDAMVNDVEHRNLLEPAGLYGFFPVITDDDLVIILDPSDYSTEKAALHFPRAGKNGNRSMADYLRPEGDVLAVQMVTLGHGTGAWTGARSDGPVSKDGFAACLVEDLAARVTLEITRGLGLRVRAGASVSDCPGRPAWRNKVSCLNFSQ